jgi:hypothetical protein
VFKNRVLRKMFGPKMNEVTRQWLRLSNEKLYGLRPIQNTIRVIKSRRMISGFRRDDDEIRALLGYYAASNANPSPTFRDNVLVPYSRVKKSKKERRIKKNEMGVACGTYE